MCHDVEERDGSEGKPQRRRVLDCLVLPEALLGHNQTRIEDAAEEANDGRHDERIDCLVAQLHLTKRQRRYVRQNRCNQAEYDSKQLIRDSFRRICLLVRRSREHDNSKRAHAEDNNLVDRDLFPDQKVSQYGRQERVLEDEDDFGSGGEPKSHENEQVGARRTNHANHHKWQLLSVDTLEEG